MKASTAIGIGLACVGLLMGATMEGSQIGSFIDPPAILIVFGGTLGATLASTSTESIKRIPGLYKRAMSAQQHDLAGRVALLVSLAEKARREGLLALESGVEDLDDEFTRKGLQLVVDGTEPEVILQVLENEIDGASGRAAADRAIFEKAGGFAPTMGILGTVLGLVHVLQNLDQPSTLGPAISGAFIATLYGVASANVVFLPVASKLQSIADAETSLRELTIEGLLAIQAGDNPRVVGDKLEAFVPPEERRAVKAAEAPAGKGAADPQPEPVKAAA
ncbi:MAG TPA: flagellar motor protein [Solirubrobacterales bacterium]|nr:flagellar motor protein [Solirubrobacterales bacterium]